MLSVLDSDRIQTQKCFTEIFYEEAFVEFKENMSPAAKIPCSTRKHNKIREGEKLTLIESIERAK